MTALADGLADFHPPQPFIEATNQHLDLGDVGAQFGDVTADLGAQRRHVLPDAADVLPKFSTPAACLGEQSEDRGGQQAKNRPHLGIVHHSRVKDAARAGDCSACNYRPGPLVALLLLGACSGDGPGNRDTLFTGFSGLLIAIVVLVLVFRWINRRDRS